MLPKQPFHSHRALVSSFGTALAFSSSKIPAFFCWVNLLEWGREKEKGQREKGQREKEKGEIVTRGVAPLAKWLSSKVLNQLGWGPKPHLYFEEPAECGTEEHWRCPINKQKHEVMQVTGPEPRAKH